MLSACPVLAVADYLSRHNAVVSILHQSMCSSYKFPIHCDKPKLYHPKSVVEGNGVKTSGQTISSQQEDLIWLLWITIGKLE